MSRKVTILVASSTLVLGKPKGADENISVPAGEELTKEIIDRVGLKKAEIEDMVTRGHLVPTPVRAAESGRGNDAAVVAAEAAAARATEALAGETRRADDAEALVKSLQSEVSTLKASLADADKDAKEADAHIEKLETQIKDQGEEIEKLTGDLAEATKPAGEKAGKA